MIRKLLLSLAVLLSGAQAFAQLNIVHQATLPYNGSTANIGGYVDSAGNEYALVGYQYGLSIVDVTNPANPVIKVDVPGLQSEWREVKTWQHYAYVTTEQCCNGLQIVDLSYLPDSVVVKNWKGSGVINNQINTIHALHIDNGYAYLYGSNLFNGAALIVDLADPWNPVYTGHTPGTYIHDGYVRNDTLYGGHIYDGYFSVMDVTNKANPTLVTTQSTPGQFTHNDWLNDAGNVLFTTDEVTNSYLASYDISDLTNIKELDRFQLTPGSGSIVHNTHTLNDFEIVSWYKDGVAIVDVSRPDNMILTGYYDTYPQGSGNGFNGCWGVYPYLPSGTLVCSDIDNGLIVLTPTYVRACYLEGNVTDSVTTSPLYGVTVTILSQNTTKQTKLNGDYKTGLATAGIYDVQFSKAGYATQTITGVVLQNGVLTTLNVQLVPLSNVVATGTVMSVNGQPVGNAIVHLKSSQFDILTNSDPSGNFSVSNFFSGNYEITAGKWGWNTYCTSANLTGSSPVNIVLAPGYYDDFSLEFNWGISGTSPNAWERGVPIGTYTNANVPANPSVDAGSNCGSECYVTDNGGGSVSDHDIDNGNCILTSPTFDLSTAVNPILSYFRWFYNGATSSGQPDDTMKVKLTNGIDTVIIEEVNPTSPFNSTWVQNTIPVLSYIALTSNMHLIVDIGDPGPVFNFLEGGFDNFVITDAVGVQAVNDAVQILTAAPNPFSNQVSVRWKNENAAPGHIEVMDMTGKVVSRKDVGAGNGTTTIGQELSAGIYTVRLVTTEGLSRALRIVKQD